MGNGLYGDGGNFEKRWRERGLIGMMESWDGGRKDWREKGMVGWCWSEGGLKWGRKGEGEWNGYLKYNGMDG